MCLSGILGGGNDDSAKKLAKKQAQAAAAAEAKRQADITAGRTSIDNTFAQFDDPWYQGYAKDYSSYYIPQLDQQYQDAREQKIYSLARSGNLDASAGAKEMGVLDRTYHDNQGQIGARAQAAALAARSQADSYKGQLYSDLSASADPAAAAAQATARAAAMSQPQVFSPLGNLFAGLAGQAGTAVAAQQQGYPGWNMGFVNSTPLNFNNSGSARVVA